MLELYSEPKGTGGFLAEGVKKLLGSPDIEPHAILVRECAQNSWDARLDGQGPYFGVDVRPLGEGQRQALIHEVLVDAWLTESELTGSPVLEFLKQSQESWVIELSDRETTGLTGNIDPRIATSEGESRNFTDLVFTYGATRNSGNTGGTYGFGKVAAFGSSALGTVIYWTRCEHKGKLEYRLIASRLAEEVDRDGLSYTGRHWWGRLDSDANVLPLVGENARILGEKIFSRGFDGRETGTSIMVLKPRMPVLESGGEDISTEYGSTEGLAESIRDSVLTNLWPKITPRPDGTTPMHIEVKYKSATLEFGDPAVGLWKTWADALNIIRRAEAGGANSGSNVQHWPISYLRQSPVHPPGFLNLGNFAISKGFDFKFDTNFDRLFSGRNGMYCRMRAPELVVDYVPLPNLGQSDSYFGGVFKVLNDPYADAKFAEAEGPTHSEWNGSKTPQARGVVQTAKKRILEKCSEYFATFEPIPIDGPQFNGKIAEQLRYLVPIGSGPDQASRGKQRGAGSRARVSSPTLENIEFVNLDKRGFQIQMATVRTPKADGNLAVNLTVQRIGGGIDVDLDPDDLEVSWLDRSGSTVATGPYVMLKGETRYRAMIATLGGYRLRVKVGAGK